MFKAWHGHHLIMAVFLCLSLSCLVTACSHPSLKPLRYSMPLHLSTRCQTCILQARTMSSAGRQTVPFHISPESALLFAQYRQPSLREAGQILGRSRHTDFHHTMTCRPHNIWEHQIKSASSLYLTCQHHWRRKSPLQEALRIWAQARQ